MSDIHQSGFARRKRIQHAILLIMLVSVASFLVSCRSNKAMDEKVTTSSSEVNTAKDTSSQQTTDDQTNHIIPVTHISQKNLLSAGCELVSAMMLLDHYGFHPTADEIVARTPISSLLYENGSTYGLSPNQAFIGDPQSDDGLGCYATVLTAIVNSYFWDDGEKEAINLTGTELDKLEEDYLAKSSPVIIWATVDMQEPYSGPSWILADTNETFQWISGEHCLLLVGYDDENYYFSDPYDSTGIRIYNKSVVKQRYSQLGKQAVAIHSDEGDSA